jgi:hypothetical protein
VTSCSVDEGDDHAARGAELQRTCHWERSRDARCFSQSVRAEAIDQITSRIYAITSHFRAFALE